MDFSQRFAALRKEHKWTQEKVGELVNMSQRSVANWESGERSPSIPTLIELSNTFNVSIDYMLGCSDVPQKAKEQPAIQNGKLLSDVISRIQDLPEPALSRVCDFLDGIQAGREVAAAEAADPDPDAEPAQ